MKDKLHKVGTFRGRNLYLETPDKGVVDLFEEYMANLENVNRLYNDIKLNQEMSNFGKIFSLKSKVIK